MCGRFAFYSPAEAAAALFGLSDYFPVEPRFNIARNQGSELIEQAGDVIHD